MKYKALFNMLSYLEQRLENEILLPDEGFLQTKPDKAKRLYNAGGWNEVENVNEILVAKESLLVLQSADQLPMSPQGSSIELL